MEELMVYGEGKKWFMGMALAKRVFRSYREKDGGEVFKEGP